MGLGSGTLQLLASSNTYSPQLFPLQNLCTFLFPSQLKHTWLLCRLPHLPSDPSHLPALRSGSGQFRAGPPGQDSDQLVVSGRGADPLAWDAFSPFMDLQADL